MKKIFRGLAVLLAVMAAILPLSAAAPLSPGLHLLAAEYEMVKSGLIAEEICFSADDFSRAVNLAQTGSVTLTRLPPETEGLLKLGGVRVKEGQTISQRQLDLLRFSPASAAVTESSFEFVCGERGYAISCSLYLLPTLNFSPTVALADPNVLTVSTHRAVSCFGSLPAHDPEGDALTYEIVTPPKKGTVTLLDETRGDYRYTPTAGKSGKDSFRYVVRDCYGNYSTAAEVTVTITRPSTSVVYADMTEHWACNAALTMTEQGIMQGRQVGKLYYFDPDGTVSRGDFLVMAMNVLGITEVPASADTGFADDDEIPTAMKGYVAAARELGYIHGRSSIGGVVFAANETITRAEAAVMLGNMLDPALPTVKPVFADAAGVPEWAYDALSALNAMGVFKGTGSGMIAAGQLITRAQAAQILCAVAELD